MIKIDQKDIIRFEHALGKMSKSALPKASAYALNKVAMQARDKSIQHVKSNMILRNKYTERSIRYNKTFVRDISKQQTIVGSTVAYMKDQENGKTIRSKGKNGVPIPTAASSGQTGANIRTKVVRRAYRMANIHLQKRRIGKTRKQTNAMAISHVFKKGTLNNRFAFLDLGNSKGLFKITGRKRHKIKFTMLYNMTKKEVKIPQNKWLEPSSYKASESTLKYYSISLQHHLKRYK